MAVGKLSQNIASIFYQISNSYSMFFLSQLLLREYWGSNTNHALKKFKWRAEAVVYVVIGSDTEKEKLMELIEFGSSTVVYWKIFVLTQIFFFFTWVTGSIISHWLGINCRRFAVYQLLLWCNFSCVYYLNFEKCTFVII